MKLSMTQVEAFVAVLAVGTATGAASILNTSQPSISRSIRQMEDATGLRLFDRSRGGFLPTAAAQELAETIEISFKGMGDIRRAAEAIRKRETRLIRIACLPAFSHSFLAGAVSSLLKRDASVSVSIQPLLSKDIHEAVHKKLIDIGIAAYEVDDPNLTVHRFTTLDEIVLVPLSHPLAEKRQIAPLDLEGERLILMSKFDPYRVRLDNILDAEAIRPARVIEVETSASACALVAEGTGVTIINPITALEFIHSGLAMRSFTHGLPFVTTLVSAKSGSQLKLVRRFEKILQESLQDAKSRIDMLLTATA